MIVKLINRLLLFLFLCSTTQAHAILNAPELACASVLGNGDVVLTWIPPSDPTGIFSEYRVYHASAIAGPYAQVGTINNYLTNTFTHAAAGANSAAQFYFVNVLDNGPAPNLSVDSDTLATLFLTVNQSTPLGNAVLSWNTQHTPVIPSANQEYYIELEYPQGVWNVIDTTAYTVLNYAHVVSVCSDSLSFRISLSNALGCTSVSNINGDQFEDSTPPTVPQVITASVDTASGLATFKWNASPEADTDGYIIVNIISTGNVIIDTVMGQFNTTYVDSLGDPTQASLAYTVAAFDTCFSGNPPQPNTSATLVGQSTIHLTGIYDECAPSVFLQWSPYLGWDSVPNYELYVEVNNGPPFLLANIAQGQFNYTDLSTAPFNDYCYFIKTIGSDSCEVSFSNRFCLTTDYPGLPNFNYVRVATVQNNGHVRIVDRVDVAGKVQGYRLERAQNDGVYTQIDYAGPTTSPDIVFNDFNVQADQFAYQYRVVVEDSCGNDALTSNEAGTIWLRTTSSLDGFNQLSWNGYQEWDGIVAGYRIYRSEDNGPFSVIGLVPPAQWYFDDDVNAYTESSGRFCYYVEALESGNTIAPDTMAVSNVSCTFQEDLVFIPNAFIAGGFNTEFYAVSSFADLKNLNFSIFNRWGQIIWQAENVDDRWDGKVNGEYVPQGVYGYIFSYAKGNGKRVELKGSVTFINLLD